MLIGRENEIETLMGCYESERSEFVAVYGRRRVGKTFLIKELFEARFMFYSTGILGESKQAQLLSWNHDISHYGGADFAEAANWMEAFINLNRLVERVSSCETMTKRHDKKGYH